MSSSKARHPVQSEGTLDTRRRTPTGRVSSKPERVRRPRHGGAAGVREPPGGGRSQIILEILAGNEPELNTRRRRPSGVHWIGRSFGAQPGTARDAPPSSGTRRTPPLATEAATKRPSGRPVTATDCPNWRTAARAIRRCAAHLRLRSGHARDATALRVVGQHQHAITSQPSRPVTTAKWSRSSFLPAAAGIATTVPPRMASAQFPSRTSSCGSRNRD